MFHSAAKDWLIVAASTSADAAIAERDIHFISIPPLGLGIALKIARFDFFFYVLINIYKYNVDILSAFCK